MTLTLRADPRDGRPNTCSECPIAAAFRRALPRATAVVVSRTHIHWTDPDGGYLNRRSAVLPAAARAWLARLDDGGAEFLGTLEFAMEVPG